MRRLAVAAVVCAAVAGALVAYVTRSADAYVAHHLVSDRGLNARTHDHVLVNAWGLAASPTGPWWTANEASETSTLYDDRGRKQALTVEVKGGPTGIVYNHGKGFEVRQGSTSGPARFIYACEDGAIRGWSPVVPEGWSTEAVVAVDDAATGAVLRGLALAKDRLYVTDFHNDKVLVYDSNWKPVKTKGTFHDPRISTWYQPFGIQAVGDRIFVTFASPAPVNGNDAPHGGYVDEFDLEGRLVSRVAHMGPLDQPWGVAMSPAGKLYVGNFGTGRIAIFSRRTAGWHFDGFVKGEDGEPLSVNGLWGIAFGNDGMAGPKDTLFFAAGPHKWLGASELDVRGLFGAVKPT